MDLLVNFNLQSSKMFHIVLYCTVPYYTLKYSTVSYNTILWSLQMWLWVKVLLKKKGKNTYISSYANESCHLCAFLFMSVHVELYNVHVYNRVHMSWVFIFFVSFVNSLPFWGHLDTRKAGKVGNKGVNFNFFFHHLESKILKFTCFFKSANCSGSCNGKILNILDFCNKKLLNLCEKCIFLKHSAVRNNCNLSQRVVIIMSTVSYVSLWS